MLKSVKLNYDFDLFLSADYSVHKGSCIKHQVTELTDIHEQYGGFPDSYCFENTVIHQLWWTAEQIDYRDIGEQLGVEVVTVSTILQPPGGVIPLHRDTFYQISKRYPDRTDTKVRANIYLEDWKLGHFIQYDDIVSTHWTQGQGFVWDSEVLHLGANAGMEPKYTLQVSGFLKS
jgi:hypothetical protein